jgi:23S rRNA (cytidine1920-2'-O)/16S rRNA (cytidine1409-2'-O)-methyltransferase
MDVSFVSSRQLLPHLAKKASNPNTQFVIMVKPQFEADRNQVNKGVIKNDSMRRKILSDFENWTKDLFVIKDKKDSEVAGAKGNRERFYLLKKST